MRWDPGHQSDDVEDRRGEAPVRGGGGGLFGLFFLLARTPLGVGGALLVVGAIVAFGWIRGALAPPDRASDHAPSRGGVTSQAEDREAAFVSFVLDDVQATWEREFATLGKPYTRAKLVLFRDSTNTACGVGESATGPFYCPPDRRAYLDLSFFDELETRLHARGDFAKAYVIAHELGHHVQALLDVKAMNGGAAKKGADGSSVRLELQADCYAGVWARSTSKRDLLESGDLPSALTAAAAIGDDTLQKKGTGVVRPESFTHGTSAERQRWFKRGLENGVAGCDTFGATKL
ncbi:MAG: neutral zinc metallopeptidase [Polyangiaceae bacterium]